MSKFHSVKLVHYIFTLANIIIIVKFYLHFSRCLSSIYLTTHQKSLPIPANEARGILSCAINKAPPATTQMTAFLLHDK